jgi:hypothetical protein
MLRARSGSPGIGFFLLATASIVAMVPTRSTGAQELVPDVEYISGHAGFSDKQKGILLIGESVVKFNKKDGTTLFTIPLDSITDIGSQTDVRDASVGKKLLLGGFAGTRKQEFVQVTYESPTMAEGLVFKVKDGAAPGVIAKVKFAIKKRKTVTPADTMGHPQPAAPSQ